MRIVRLICSACNNDIIVVEHSNIELDYCTARQGVWFDGGELGQLVRQMVKQPVDKSNHHEQVLTFLQEVFQANAYIVRSMQSCNHH